MSNNYEQMQMVEMLKNGQNIIIDDHNTGVEELQGIIKFVSEFKGVGALLSSEYRYYSINELYVSEKDNNIHLSMCSVGGVMYPTGSEPKDIILDVLKYNDTIIMEGGKIETIYLKDCYIKIGKDVESCLVKEYDNVNKEGDDTMNKTYEDGLNEGYLKACNDFEGKFRDQANDFTQQLKKLRSEFEESNKLFDQLENTRNNVLNNIRSRHNELKELCLEIEENNPFFMNSYAYVFIFNQWY